MTRTALICAVTASACLFMVTGQPAAGAVGIQPGDWPRWLQEQAPAFAGAVVIGRDDQIDVEAAYGLAGPPGARANTPGTRFNLGSINKTFTAVAIAQLVQQGRIGLDDTLAKHIPDYPNKEAATRITLRQLLTHRSGVAQFMRADFGDATVAEMVRTVGAQPQVFEPGARQEYSNGGYVVLGRIVEVASGVTYDAYVRDRIYQPAGMTSSGFYSQTAGSLFALPITGGELRRGNPAGGGYSTAADLYRFSRALEMGRLLDRTMTAYLLEGTFTEQPRWGFSLREQIVGTRRFIGNGGGAPGVNAEFRFEPAGPYTVVVLSNTSPPAATNLLTAILERIAASTSSPATAPR